jgi:hypothetical protein
MRAVGASGLPSEWDFQQLVSVMAGAYVRAGARVDRLGATDGTLGHRVRGRGD